MLKSLPPNANHISLMHKYINIYHCGANVPQSIGISEFTSTQT